MFKQHSFKFQLLVIGGFFAFFYMFFALVAAVYRDHKMEEQIARFEQEIERLALAAKQKPLDIEYHQTEEWKDFYAKQTLNLLNPGERVIILPSSDRITQQGEVELMADQLSPDSILNQAKPIQWKAYFFGQTLSVRGAEAGEAQSAVEDD